MTSVVTNLSDLTPAMREALETLNPNGTATILHRTVGNALVGKGLAVRTGDRYYAITDAGTRARDLIERKDAVRVVESLGSYGWSMLTENEFGGHAITIWTRDEHTLVLSWTGAYEVSAAIYDGTPLPLDQLVETVTSEGEQDGRPDHVLDLAARRAGVVANPRHAHELADLLSVLASLSRQLPVGLPRPVTLTAAALAAAILATPHTR